MGRTRRDLRMVDVHACLDPGEPRNGRAVEPERLERELHDAGIVRALVHPGPRDRGYLAANNAVARLSVERPFVALARVNGPRDPGRRLPIPARRKEWHTSPEDVEQFAYDDRFHGFVLDPARDGLPDEATLAAMADAGLPTLVFGGEPFPPDRVATTLLDWAFPLVLTSFGGHPLNRELMHEAIDLLERYDSLYLETSGVRYREPLERALTEHPDRVLFGSGVPAVHPSVGVMELLTCSVDESAIERAFDRNPSRVFPALD
ncbi:amidohydrolase family protein [Natronomonas sp. EA1]|uniref:amidohydrolase family protein n=1 Tax=Natronomonas sp. EA1 TaxID=3421655 RepID=UPI003EBACCE9